MDARYFNVWYKAQLVDGYLKPFANRLTPSSIQLRFILCIPVECFANILQYLHLENLNQLSNIWFNLEINEFEFRNASHRLKRYPAHKLLYLLENLSNGAFCWVTNPRQRTCQLQIAKILMWNYIWVCSKYLILLSRFVQSIKVIWMKFFN